MPLWVWGLLIVYFSLLFAAALWAAVERTRSALECRRQPARVERASDEPDQIAA